MTSNEVCDTGHFLECEVRLEKSVTRVNARYPEACQVIPNSHPK